MLSEGGTTRLLADQLRALGGCGGGGGGKVDGYVGHSVMMVGSSYDVTVKVYVVVE